jgi:hypothetical protein
MDACSVRAHRLTPHISANLVLIGDGLLTPLGRIRQKVAQLVDVERLDEMVIDACRA